MTKLITLSMVAMMTMCLLGNRGCGSRTDGGSGGSGTAGGGASTAGRDGTGVAGANAGAGGTGSSVPDAGANDDDAGANEDDAGSNEDDAGTPRACGTRGGVQCAAYEFCNYGATSDCGATDRGGRCETRPEACDLVFDPVCGCDGRSYGNACEAHAAGVSVGHVGMCTSSECTQSGGRPAYSDGASTPTCRAGEESWPIGGTDEPALCCLPTQGGRTCGGIASLECDSGEFCNYEAAAGGQGCDGTISDAAGVCTTQPQVCTREYRPVCGCDLRTYSTACTAHAAGVSVLHEGACNEIECKRAGGRTVDGIGPAAMCDANEVSYGPVTYSNSNGQVAIEGTLCCVPK